MDSGGRRAREGPFAAHPAETAGDWDGWVRWHEEEEGGVMCAAAGLLSGVALSAPIWLLLALLVPSLR